MSATLVASAVEELRAGRLAVLPTDTVYGLVADGASESAARRLYAAKGRETVQPTAILFSSIERMVEDLPELPEHAVAAARALLPGPVTLVLPNPARRFGWLNVRRPDTVGVRIPALAGDPWRVLDALGLLVATSANLPGGPDPRRLGDVPPEIRSVVGVVIDGGELPGTPSTVIDLCAPEPTILREGALPASEALRLLRAAGR